MFDPRISAAAAGTAFVLSLLLGLTHGARLPWLLIRPLVFALLFFLISTGIYQVVIRFLPELLEEDPFPDSEEEPAEAPGARIDIMENNGPGPALFPGDDEEENTEDLGNISELIGGGAEAPARERPGAVQSGGNNYAPPLDHSAENGYTGGRAGGNVSAGDSSSPRPVPVSEAAAVPRPVSQAAPGDLENVDILPDLDSLAGAFLTSGTGEEETTDYSSAGAVKKPSSGGKGQNMAGDFNPKELAAAIRTKLKREEG
ncbi:MAG: hypothetical protein LBP32_01405 [Spirochaetaceae bacterium]|jgi:hypothetical protein|nr:hypothetical protein [Spirochaetaceae bacterium]